MSSKKQEVRSRKSVADLRSKSIEELQKLLAVSRADLLEAQKSLKANELANPRVVSKMKREVARILTIIHETEITEKGKEVGSKKQEAESDELQTSSLKLPTKATKGAK